MQLVPTEAGKEDEAVVVLQAVHVGALGQGWGKRGCEGERSNLTYSSLAHLVPHAMRRRHALDQRDCSGKI